MKQILLIGPQGIGKSIAANRIAIALGCTSVVHEWDGVKELPCNVLAISNYDLFIKGHGSNPNLNMPALMVDTPQALQTLTEALEHQATRNQ
ncbi:RNA helicase domain-containing protein [Candidatus Nitrotoga sp. M5]|uniref:RNA helicase domain-containing protein n=1 Tax=Candidatus Nitrotoga sp. M5 TaxID=2890409 RepID=UPI001EF6476D|nr:RNA helicase domain-containing protein [Candidatus Nitrotoga sp. M5]